MTATEWIITGYCTVMFVAMALHSWWGARLQREIARDLAELRRCNDEFAEAVRLMEYGALDEAVEVVLKWRERARC